MKIDVDLNKITDLSKDVKDAMRENQKEIASLNRKLNLRHSEIDVLRQKLNEKDYEMGKLLRFRKILQDFFEGGMDTIEKGDKI